MTYRKSPFRRLHKPVENKIASKAGSESTLFIYDEISWWGVSAEQFVKDLQASESETVHIRINSPGGSVFDGTSIFNAIKQHKSKTIVHIDGLAASIASIISLAADEVRMGENAFFMIHEPWSVVVGDAQMMREEADLLDKVSGTILNTYTKKTGKSDDEVKAWMQAETWFTAKEAKDAGFIDFIEDDQEAGAKAALFDLSVYANVPDKLRDLKQEPTERELEKALRDAGLSRSQAKAILTEGYRPELRDAVQDTPAPPEAPLRDAVTAPVIKDRVADLLIRAEKAAKSI